MSGKTTMDYPAPRPWSLYCGTLNDNVFRDGRTVCAGINGSRHAVAFCDYLTPERAAANAAFIVRACNAHDDLLDALKECADDLAAIIEADFDAVKRHPGLKANYDRDMVPVVAARAAIKKATAP